MKLKITRIKEFQDVLKFLVNISHEVIIDKQQDYIDFYTNNSNMAIGKVRINKDFFIEFLEIETIQIVTKDLYNIVKKFKKEFEIYTSNNVLYIVCAKERYTLPLIDEITVDRPYPEIPYDHKIKCDIKLLRDGISGVEEANNDEICFNLSQDGFKLIGKDGIKSAQILLSEYTSSVEIKSFFTISLLKNIINSLSVDPTINIGDSMPMEITIDNQDINYNFILANREVV